MISYEEKKSILIYRLERIDLIIKEIEHQIESKYYVTAMNRIYYCNFYIVMCLALLKDYKTSKHKQLMGWFNKEFLFSGKIGKEYFQIYMNSYDDRIQGDYYFRTFEKEYVLDSYSKMKDFVSVIKNEINKELL